MTKTWLSPNSPIHDVVADLARNAFIANIKFADKESLGVIKEVVRSHVFEFSRTIFGSNEKFLREKARQICNDVGLRPPFPLTCFLFRSKYQLQVALIRMTGTVLDIIGVICSPDDALHEAAIELDVNFETGDGARMLEARPLTRGWSSLFSLHGTSTAGDLDHQFTIMTGVEGGDEDIISIAEHFLDDCILPAFALLAEKADVVWTTPAPYTIDENVKLRNYHRIPPSVSIVHLNTHRILHGPIDDDGTGGTVRPHDRRSHLRRRGRKIIQVRECKVKGGAPEPVAKVSKLQNKLEVE